MKSIVFKAFVIALCFSFRVMASGKDSIAEALVSLGKYKEALKEYDRLIETDLDKGADIGLYYYRSAMILLREPSGTDEAIKRINTVLQRYKTSSQYEESWIALAEAWLIKKDRERSAETLHNYLRTFRNRSMRFDQEAYFRLAEIHLSQNRQKEALTWLARITVNQSGPYLNRALYLQGEALWNNLRDREGAYALITRFLEQPGLNPDEIRSAKTLLNRIRWQYIGREQGLQDDCVSAIAFDGDDIWFGLWLAGAARYTRSRNDMRLYTVRDGLASSYVRDIQVDEKEVWIATFEGISRYDRSRASWQRYTQIPGVGSQRIKSILVEADYVWFATLGYGIQRLRRKEQTWDDFSGIPLNIVKVRQNARTGDIAFASLNSGVILRAGSSGTVFKRIPIPGTGAGRNVKDVFFDEEGLLYIATYQTGIYRYNIASETMDLLWTPPGYLSTMAVRNGKIFAGTLGDGLRIRDIASGKERIISVIDGLQSSNILTIEFENDYIWLGTVDSGVNILYAPELFRQTSKRH